jgi:adenylate kinase family enzyme
LPGVGKTTLGQALARRLGAAYFSFGRYVRTLVAVGGEPPDRSVLQTIGEGQVERDANDFVERAMATVDLDWKVLVIDGVRHVTVLTHLKAFAKRQGANLRLIHLDADNEVRMRRLAERGIAPEAARLAENHASEQDVVRALPALANIRLETTSSLDEEVESVITSLGM